MTRVTMNNLEYLVKEINLLTNNDVEASYFNQHKKLHWNIGNYQLSGAYGGWKLEQIVNEHGGTKDIFNAGFLTKKELYYQLEAFKLGVEN